MAILFSIIIVVILCVIGVVYIALHFGAPNTIDIDTIEEYALTDKVVRPYNRYFCQGLSGKSTDSPNNFDSNATLYLLNSRPLLTDHEVFNLSQKVNLDSVNTNYQSWNFYLNSDSFVTLEACYQPHWTTERYVTFYLIKGTKNHNKWTENPSGSYAVKYSRLSGDCQTISYRAKNNDLYYFAFYLNSGNSVSSAVIRADFNFNRTVYHVPLSNVVHSCSFPLDGDSSCSIAVPTSSGYTALLSLNTSLPVDYNDGANVKISCQPRSWIYAMIILSVFVVLIAILVSVMVSVRFWLKRREKNKSHSRYSLIGENSNSPLEQSRLREDGVDATSVQAKNSSSLSSSDGTNKPSAPNYGVDGYTSRTEVHI